MKSVVIRAAIVAAVVFAALFAAALTLIDPQPSSGYGSGYYSSSGDFQVSRKNYASLKNSGGGLTAQPLGDVQKYEKVATLSQSTNAFDAAKAKIEALIAASNGLVQYENLTGLSGYRALHLGVGVPPAKFDGFIQEAGKLAELTGLSIVKNDKTNEYRELRAKRETLEKARKALVELGNSGGSVEERLKVQGQLTELEQKIQGLGVSLGDFDSENEFCTVKLSLQEIGAPRASSWPARALSALGWAMAGFAGLAGGFLMICAALWIGALALGMAIRISRSLASE
jgi:hypothetical protein